MERTDGDTRAGLVRWWLCGCGGSGWLSVLACRRRLFRLVAALRVNVKDGRPELVLALLTRFARLWCTLSSMVCCRALGTLFGRVLTLGLQALQVLKGCANDAHSAAARELLRVRERVGVCFRHDRHRVRALVERKLVTNQATELADGDERARDVDLAPFEL